MIAEALFSLRPQAKWVLNGDTLEGLEWLDDSPCPTNDEILAEAERLKPFVEYRWNRAEAYPPLTEQLDMMFHDFDAWKAVIAEVKARFPKP